MLPTKCEGGSGDGVSRSDKAPWKGPWGVGFFTGDLRKYVHIAPGYWHLSPWGPL